jgi:hypothetical protein
MKNVFSICIILFISCGIKLEAQFPVGWQYLEYCHDTECENVQWQPIVNTYVTIPELPNCTIAVGGYMRVCDGQIEIVIMGYNILGPSQDCIDDFNSLTDEQKNNLQLSIYRVLTLKLFQDYYNSLPPHLKLIAQCNGNGGQITYKGIMSSCNKTCYYWCNGGNGATLQAEVVNCSEFCCVYERKICFNTTTNDVQVTESWTNNIIGPLMCAEPFLNCYGAFYSTSCFPVCETE